MASPNLSEIVTTTLRNRTGKLADNMTKNIALLNRMNKRGTIKPVSGGRTIVQELNYAENVTYQRYSGYEVLNISPSDVFTAAEFDWKQAAVNVTISGLEGDVINTGSEAIIDTALHIEPGKQTKADQQGAALVLRAAGWERKPQGKFREWVWFKPEGGAATAPPAAPPKTPTQGHLGSIAHAPKAAPPVPAPVEDDEDTCPF